MGGVKQFVVILMHRRSAIALIALAALAACGTTNTAMRMGPDGRPVPVVYRITPADVPRIQARMRDAVNTVRAAQGLGEVTLNEQLTNAAAAHSRDMAFQARPWHFGSDGSSPVDRAQRAGYAGRFLGEMISETFETELETLAVWMETRETRVVLLEPQMNEIGFAWYQEPTGKLWWTMTTGRATEMAASF